MWGKGRIIHHENLYDLVERLKEKKPGDSLEAEKQSLKEAWERQKRYYADDIEYLIRAAEKLRNLIARSVICLKKEQNKTIPGGKNGKP